MALELGVDVSEVVEGGTALAFVAYPTAIAKENKTKNNQFFPLTFSVGQPQDLFFFGGGGDDY